MQNQDQHPMDLHEEMNLREALRAASAAQVAANNQHHIQNHSVHEHLHGPSQSPQSNNIDPAIAGQSYPLSGGDSGGEDNGDGKKGSGGKRELSTSKRAAQNRAAQRAFRQRKEGYIKKLEEQVRDYTALEETLKATQAENYQLRDYIINLQSRLIESQGEYPQPPPLIDLRDPRAADQLQQMNATAAAMAPSAVSQLQAAAAATTENNAGAARQLPQDVDYMSGSAAQ